MDVVGQDLVSCVASDARVVIEWFNLDQESKENIVEVYLNMSSTCLVLAGLSKEVDVLWGKWDSQLAIVSRTYVSSWIDCTVEYHLN